LRRGEKNLMETSSNTDTQTQHDGSTSRQKECQILRVLSFDLNRQAGWVPLLADRENEATSITRHLFFETHKIGDSYARTLNFTRRWPNNLLQRHPNRLWYAVSAALDVRVLALALI
jgi:hypothetical protein